MGFVDEMPTRQLAVPHEAGEWFEVRVLSWKELDECRNEKSRQYFRRMREMGTDIIKTVADLERDAEHDAEARATIDEARAENAAEEADAREEFDKDMLLEKSVVGWSYERVFSTKALGKLDQQTSEWLFLAIATLYVPTEEESKKDSGSSTPISTVREPVLTSGS